jgi:hypothetical protein
MTTAATIPNDHEAVQRALASQRPLILSERGSAARKLLDLAERMHGGTVRLPREPDRGRLDFLRRALPMNLTRRPRPAKLNLTGRLDDEHTQRSTARTNARRHRPNR